MLIDCELECCGDIGSSFFHRAETIAARTHLIEAFLKRIAGEIDHTRAPMIESTLGCFLKRESPSESDTTQFRVAVDQEATSLQAWRPTAGRISHSPAGFRS